MLTEPRTRCVVHSGKTEEEILQDAIKHERLRLRLSAPQLEQKQQLEVSASAYLCISGNACVCALASFKPFKHVLDDQVVSIPLSIVLFPPLVLYVSNTCSLWAGTRPAWTNSNHITSQAFPTSAK